MDERSLRRVVASLKVLSSRHEVIIVGILLPVSIALLFDMVLAIVSAVMDEGRSMVTMLHSWQFWVLLVSLCVMIYSARTLLKYAGRTGRDRDVQRLESKIDDLINEIRQDRDERNKM